MRNLKRIIYTSSYDRGLQHLLEMWPDIRKEVPDAELTICYGWQLFEKFYKDNPASMKWKEKMDNLMNQEGITHLGRVPQPELKAIMEECGIWSYPTHFGEINCISAIKAQALGLEPVVVNYAALQETVQFGRKIEGDIYDASTKKAFLKAIVEALKSPMLEEKRKEMMDWAQKKYAWGAVAQSWDAIFKE